MDTAALVLTEQRQHVGIITMNNTRRLNCLGSSMDVALMEAINRLLDAHCRVLVLRAPTGATVWSSGHDIKELHADGSDPLAWNTAFEQLLRVVRDCPIPLIGSIEGSVWGGACDLAMAMDMLIGTPTATFAMTPAKLGLPYNVTGLNDFLGVLPLHIIKEMIFTAKPISAETALRFGLLNRLVPAEELESATMAMAQDVAALAPLSIRILKKEIKRLETAPTLSPEENQSIEALRQSALNSEDFKEGIQAFLEKRPPLFHGK